MFTLLNETLLWWHWILFAVILLIIEMNLGTFVLLGLGISALIVGIFSFIFPLDVMIEIVIFSLLSVLFIVLWKRYWKSPIQTNIGQSNHTFDTLGTVIIAIPAHQQGEVRFDSPVLGTRLWSAISDEAIAKDTRIKIIDINGQLLVVKALNT